MHSTTAMGLETYRKKRDFGRTSEPRGKSGRASGPHALAFVVQKHDARRLHYDFRLELEGVLKSWAIPKGPSLDPGVKRLAVETEDHPMEYGDFEGVIPHGEYGGGPVVVWDRGHWKPEGDPNKGYANGRLKFELEGEKLHGTFHLVRTRGQGNAKSWLLMKSKDASAQPGSDSQIVDEHPESVISGLRVEEVAVDPERVWHSNRSVEDNVKAAKKKVSKPAKAKSANGLQARKTAAKSKVRAPSIPEELRSVRMTNPGRVLFPEIGVTKAQLALYYAQVAELMLPHVSHRPLMLVRCPEGVGTQCFHQKHPTQGMSPLIKRVKIPESKGLFETIYVESAGGLVQLVQNGALEIHTWGSRYDDYERADQITIDLDPDVGLPWPRIIEAAHDVKRRFEKHDLPTFLKTTGGKGLHIVVPIAPSLEWDELKTLCKAFAQSMVRAAPTKYVATISKAQRKGKVLIDYLRNGRGATAVCAYSTRARATASVAAPIAWSELTEDLRPDQFTLHNIPERLASVEDPWRDFGKNRPKLTPALQRALSK
jgi:bifunctional non-homologous end joining protein LigD